MTHAEHRRRLIEYLEAKVAIADWHAVADAAMDLRELDAEKRGREQEGQRHPVGCACQPCRGKVM